MSGMHEARVAALPARHRRYTAAGTADGDTPAEYRGKNGSLQVIDVVDEFNLGFYEGTVVALILRAPNRGGRADLVRAYHFLGQYLDRAMPAEPDTEGAGPGGYRGADH